MSKKNILNDCVNKNLTHLIKKKGISLIVLIITIVVIVIVSGTIILNLKDTNIIDNAKKATEKMRVSEVESYIEIWKAEKLIDEYLNGETKTDEEMLSELIEKKLVYDDEIDRENKIIIIGDKMIKYDENITNNNNNNNNSNNILDKMNICWTLGNSLDNDSKRSGLTVEEYETSWGNPVTTNKMIKAVKDAGFDTVRIPVTWFNHLDSQNKVDEAWMVRVKEIVDYVVNNDMIAIIDIHHDDKLMELEKDKVTFANVINKYSYVWEQIANTFKNYDERLIFEIINEPRVILEDGSSDWTPVSDIPYENLNDFYSKMVQTIRSTGGKNSNRLIILPTYGTGITRTILEKLKLPNDSNIAVSAHGYLPYEYCGDSAVEYTEDMYESLRYKADLLEEYSKTNNVPVIISELGCVQKSDRVEWYKDMYSYFTYKGMKLVIWDNGHDSEYKLFDRNTLKVTDETLLNTIKTTYANAKKIKNNSGVNIVEDINTTSNVATDKSDMEVKLVDGKNYYCINTNSTISCRFKFSDIYELNDDYKFFEFSYKVKTDMKDAKIKLVINFMDEFGNVISKVDYDNISKEIDGTKSEYEIKRNYRVIGAKKVQIERLAVEGQDVDLEMYDISLRAM